jgi:exodeoxyribonuclease-3
MLLATWNVNGIQGRLPATLGWMVSRGVDVICLQEIKCEAREFPFAAFWAAGYHVAVEGQKHHHGVAIASRLGLAEVVNGLADGKAEPEARLLSATVGGLRILSVYAPHGREVGSASYQEKLTWMARLRSHLDARYRPDHPVALCGDFNVAPESRDVYDPQLWLRRVHFHTAARAGLKAVQDFGLKDAIRLHHRGPGLYTWWDYKGSAFDRDLGLRIDHILVTRPLAERCAMTAIDRSPRGLPHSTDHAPVLAAFLPL